MKTYEPPYVEIIDIIPQTVLGCSGNDVFYMNGKEYYYSADSKKYYCPIKENFKCPFAKDDFPTTDYCIIEECAVYFSKEEECGEDFLKKQQFFYCPIKGDVKCPLAKKKFPCTRLCYKEPCEILAEWSKEQYLIRKYGIRPKTK